MRFATTYLSELGFLTITTTKTKKGNDDQDDR